jgi:hypothetical protein
MEDLTLATTRMISVGASKPWEAINVRLYDSSNDDKSVQKLKIIYMRKGITLEYYLGLFGMKVKFSCSQQHPS